MFIEEVFNSYEEVSNICKVLSAEKVDEKSFERR